jgi:hypothetical protein
MKIKNIENLTDQEISWELQNGAKFVYFQYTISILVMTFKRPSDIYFLRANESHWGKSMPFTLLSLVLGWWGFPWGLIYTPMVLFSNLSGGKDVTNEIVGQIVPGKQLMDAHLLDA